MNCAEYRRSLLTVPGDAPAAMHTHAAGCPDCARYTERLLRFDARLESALKVEVRPAQGSRVVPLAAARRRLRSGRSRLQIRGMAVAASVLLAVVGVGVLWLAAPGRSLAAAVVNHMADEPDAWARTDVPVPARELEAVMSESGVRLRSSAGLVSYVHSCEFRGHRVPHLVVQTDAGPVTVMVLSHEAVQRDVRFAEHGYSGIIVPVRDHGSLAVLERMSGPGAPAINAVAARVLGALDFTT